MVNAAWFVAKYLDDAKLDITSTRAKMGAASLTVCMYIGILGYRGSCMCVLCSIA